MPSVAVAPTGDAVVAWVQSRRKRNRVVVARRRPGGAFGAVEPLTPWRRGGELNAPGGDATVAAAISAAGAATIAWALPTADDEIMPEAATVGTAHAPPGGRFTHQAIDPEVRGVTRVALAVAPDGWSLLAYDDIAGLHALDRAPAAPRFSEAFRAERTDAMRGFAMPVVAVRDGGGGLVAWRTAQFESGSGVIATTRAAAGPFGPLQVVVPDTSRGSFGVSFGTTAGGPPSDDDNGALRGALAADGRALLAWTADRHDVLRTTVAAGTLAAGFGEPASLSGPLRDVNGLAPLFLTDGRAAVAWTDNATSLGFAVGQGRLHVAVESAPPTARPAPPRATVTARRRLHLFDSQSVHARVGCDRACDVRVTLARAGEEGIAEVHSLRRAGTIPVELRRFDDRPRRFARDRRRIRVRATAPNGRDVATITRTVVIRRRPSLPVPRPLELRAVRRGGTIVVRWRTGFPARRVVFAVIGQHTRRLVPDSLTDPGAFAAKRGRGRTRFRLRLRPERPARVRWIGFVAFSLDGARGHRAVVRVRSR
jgi:hypothetical protein